MRFTSTTLLLVLCGLSLSTLCVAGADYPVGEWHPPIPTDYRGPCPGLNTLANHGYLPRNGEDITLKMIEDAAMEGFGIHKDVTDVGAANAQIQAQVFAGGSMANLAVLDDTHGELEHDVSLTRSDRYLGDYVKLNATLLNQWLPDLTAVLSTKDIAAWRSERIADSQVRNPEMSWRLFPEQFVSASESAFIATIFGKWELFKSGPQDIAADVLYDFFTNERLPWHLGWEKRTIPITGLEFFPLATYFTTKEQPCDIADPITVPPPFAITGDEDRIDQYVVMPVDTDQNIVIDHFSTMGGCRDVLDLSMLGVAERSAMTEEMVDGAMTITIPFTADSGARRSSRAPKNMKTTFVLKNVDTPLHSNHFRMAAEQEEEEEEEQANTSDQSTDDTSASRSDSNSGFRNDLSFSAAASSGAVPVVFTTLCASISVLMWSVCQ
eukprot:TRINITY_DN3598_c0_g1_i2.p1 TRINITY_DN3598_c0_g1~~TRINITY_DN3598_c0_g1_i2.p1  ORF type:complete len:438 (+),score=80.69 TRINITY_DN3598_c0_g1_i2:163-1476(+)